MFGILGPMRKFTWIIGLVALGAPLDSSLYDGAYTRALVNAIQDMHTAIGLK